MSSKSSPCFVTQVYCVSLRLAKSCTGTKKGELQLDISPSRLAVTLTWHGPVLDGLLTSMIRAREVLWVIEREGKDGAGGPCSLSMVLPKTKASYWRSLFEGSEMRSHWEVGRDVAASYVLHSLVPGQYEQCGRQQSGQPQGAAHGDLCPHTHAKLLHVLQTTH